MASCVLAEGAIVSVGATWDSIQAAIVRSAINDYIEGFPHPGREQLRDAQANIEQLHTTTEELETGKIK